MTQPTPSQMASLGRYNAFWKREKVDRLLFGFGMPYAAKHLAKSRELQKGKDPITLDMMEPEAFLPSYEELFQIRASLPGDIFFTLEPVNGFPWIEAMLGCQAVPSGQGYSALHYVNTIDELEKIPVGIDTPWCKRYFEFIDILSTQFKDRAGIGQPITRGISDLLGALMGPEQMVYALADEPERMKKFIRRLTDFYVDFYREHMRRVAPFLGGYMLGFYDLWCPEKCFWFQDDNLVLFSPEMYEEFFLDFMNTITQLSPYNLIHTHSVCFQNLELLLGVEKLGVLEVNREMTDKEFHKLLPTLRRIQEVKLLDIQGTFNAEDIELILNELPTTGLFLKCVVENVEDAPGLYEAFCRASRNERILTKH